MIQSSLFCLGSSLVLVSFLTSRVIQRLRRFRHQSLVPQVFRTREIRVNHNVVNGMVVAALISDKNASVHHTTAAVIFIPEPESFIPSPVALDGSIARPNERPETPGNLDLTTAIAYQSSPSSRDILPYLQYDTEECHLILCNEEHVALSF